MIVTPIPHSLKLDVSDAPRSSGLHMSEIYNSFYKELAGDDIAEGWPEEPLMLAAAGGFEFERSVEAAYRRQDVCAWRPEERMSPEGIAYSPDLFMLLDEDNGRIRIADMKRKYMSSRDFPKELAHSLPQKFAKNVTQLKVYCHCEGTTLARSIVEFVLGDYSRPFMPQLFVWDIEFTERECAEEYAMLLNHARHKGMLA